MYLQEADYIAQVALDILAQNLHRPYVDGKCNRECIEDAIFMGIYSKELEPMNENDVDFICSLLDSLIIEDGAKK